MIQEAARKYIDTYVVQADEYRFGKERADYPRSRQIIEENANATRGRRFVKNLWQDKLSPLRLAVQKMDRWFLAKYPQRAELSFLALDFDRHGDSSDVDAQFWGRLCQFQGLGIPGCFYFSPGQIVNGVLRQGVWFLLSFDRPHSIAELRGIRDRIRAALGYQIESSVDEATTHTKMYRLPGQLNMPMVAVDAENECFYALNHKDDFDSFLSVWSSRPITDLETVSECLDGVEAVHLPLKRMQKAPRAVRVLKTLGDPGSSKKLAEQVERVKRRSLFRLVPVDCQQVHCTFTIAAKLAGEIVRKYRGDVSQRGRIETELAQALPLYRPADSDTCGDARLLAGLTGRITDWMLGVDKNTGKRRYDPSKSRFDPAKEEADRQRIKSTLAVDPADIVKVFKSLNPSKQDKMSFTRLFDKIEQYNGRVSARAIWMDDNALCSHKQWVQFVKKYKDTVISILDPHSVAKSKCRQWGLSQRFIHLANLLPIVRAGNQTIMAERKRERNVYLSSAAPDPSIDLFIVKSGRENDKNQQNLATLRDILDEATKMA